MIINSKTIAVQPEMFESTGTVQLIPTKEQKERTVSKLALSAYHGVLIAPR
jgi:hypothetical protein